MTRESRCGEPWCTVSICLLSDACTPFPVPMPVFIYFDVMFKYYYVQVLCVLIIMCNMFSKAWVLEDCATNKSLVLVDELFKHTTFDEGLALALAYLEGLAELKVKFGRASGLVLYDLILPFSGIYTGGHSLS